MIDLLDLLGRCSMENQDDGRRADARRRRRGNGVARAAVLPPRAQREQEAQHRNPSALRGGLQRAPDLPCWIEKIQYVWQPRLGGLHEPEARGGPSERERVPQGGVRVPDTRGGDRGGGEAHPGPSLRGKHGVHLGKRGRWERAERALASLPRPATTAET